MADTKTKFDQEKAFGVLAELLQGIEGRLAVIENALQNAPAVAAANEKDAPTKRKQEEGGEWVFDSDGCTPGTDRETGEVGFWAISSKGNYVLCDKTGRPFFARGKEDESE